MLLGSKSRSRVGQHVVIARVLSSLVYLVPSCRKGWLLRNEEKEA